MNYELEKQIIKNLNNKSQIEQKLEMLYIGEFKKKNYETLKKENLTNYF
jgi:uncharacterized protein YfkK (UPF0435 family)